MESAPILSSLMLLCSPMLLACLNTMWDEPACHEEGNPYRKSYTLCIPWEYRLLLSLLSGRVVVDAHLVREAFSCKVDRSVQKNLDKHIDKMRTKLQLAALGVHRVSKYGYVLLAVPV